MENLGNGVQLRTEHGLPPGHSHVFDSSQVPGKSIYLLNCQILVGLMIPGVIKTVRTVQIAALGYVEDEVGKCIAHVEPDVIGKIPEA